MHTHTQASRVTDVLTFDLVLELVYCAQRSVDWLTERVTRGGGKVNRRKSRIETPMKSGTRHTEEIENENSKESKTCVRKRGTNSANTRKKSIRNPREGVLLNCSCITCKLKAILRGNGGVYEESVKVLPKIIAQDWGGSRRMNTPVVVTAQKCRQHADF